MALYISFLLLAFSVLVYWISRKKPSKEWIVPQGEFPLKWRKILLEHVSFYSSLSPTEKTTFEMDILEFIANVTITGINTEVEDIDRVLIACGGMIPIFAFPEWKYFNLQEVLLYPKSFNRAFETEGEDTNILGMVGTGYMNGKMILSKPSLRKGFAIDSDGKNTAIHEFIHLIDKKDGFIDGEPKVLYENQFALPWFDLMDKKIEEIREGKNDIRQYGGTSRTEFFAVLGEYFFEKPRMLQSKHPELYKILEDFFNQDMAARRLKMKRVKIGRNDYCYCGSGKKFKNCCA